MSRSKVEKSFKSVHSKKVSFFSLQRLTDWFKLLIDWLIDCRWKESFSKVHSLKKTVLRLNLSISPIIPWPFLKCAFRWNGLNWIELFYLYRILLTIFNWLLSISSIIKSSFSVDTALKTEYTSCLRLEPTWSDKNKTLLFWPYTWTPK